MDGLTTDAIAATAGFWEYVWEPVANARWSDWQGFWLRHVLDDRFLVCLFLPLLPILWLFSRRHLRTGIVLTGLAFLGYVFGVAFVLFWLALCAGFYRLMERFAFEAQRKDVVQWGPPLAAIACIIACYVVSLNLSAVRLPADWNLWLFHHATWLFPLGARQLPWDSYASLYALEWSQSMKAQPPQLFYAVFLSPMCNGLVIFVIRMIHYASELRRDSIPRERRSYWNFLAYVSYAPALMQGPIERFKEFNDEIDTCHQRRSWANLLRGLARMALGLSKGLFCTFYLFPLLCRLVYQDRYYWHPEQVESVVLLALGVHLHALWLYLEFSGYCDVSAGMAHVLGYRQIENFERPWLATSLRDFWRRWHISFSYILRDYVYIPLGGSRKRHTLNLCITFLVCGLLHNLHPYFLQWGLVMALMVTVNHHWAKWMKRLDQRPANRLSAIRRACLKLQPLPRICAWALTMNAFVGSCLVMVSGLDNAWRVPWELIRRTLTYLGLM